MEGTRSIRDLYHMNGDEAVTVDVVEQKLTRLDSIMEEGLT